MPVTFAPDLVVSVASIWKSTSTVALCEAPRVISVPPPANRMLRMPAFADEAMTPSPIKENKSPLFMSLLLLK